MKLYSLRHGAVKNGSQVNINQQNKKSNQMEDNKFVESFLDFSGMPESMEELLKGKEGADTITKGKIVEGTIVAKRQDGALVDIGYKAEGFIPAAEFMNFDEIELGIIPGVSFDKQGNRLGRGKGYYDKLLPLLPHAYNIGICYRFQAREEIPAEPFDRQMDEVWTEEGRWSV